MSEELERAVERLSSGMGKYGFANVYNDDVQLLLSERAELLSDVERMQGALEEADRRLSRPDWTVQRDVTRMAIRAALTTGEDK